MRLLIVAVMAILAPSVMAYDEKYDKIDVDKIIENDAVFSEYINCLLDKGPCSVEHSEDFKKIFPEVIATACAKCTPIQRGNIRKSVKALTDKRPEEFDQFRKLYDPKGEYEKDFLAFITGTD